jgi:hypothetical protein
MGVSLINSSSSSFDAKPGALPNPDPRRYKILRTMRCRQWLLLELEYLGCTNFEGRKILLFRNTTLEDLRKQVAIDPHFSDNATMISPVARFIPTQDGWEMAKRLMIHRME